MDVHSYDRDTGEYLGTRPAKLDPLEGTPLLPANATFTTPPVARAGVARRWNVDAWEEVPDHRGTVYWLPDGSEGRVTSIGVEPPADALDAPPPPPFEEVRATAVASAVALAQDYRAAVLATRPERAIGWLLKALFGAVGQMHDAAADENPARAALAAIGTNGFETEASITGEDAATLRDAAVASAANLFLALQLIEGMERIASRDLPAAQTQEDLDTTIDRLRALEDHAATQLAQITGGSNV